MPRTPEREALLGLCHVKTTITVKDFESHLCVLFACNLPRGEGEATDAGVFFSVISAELNNGARATGAGFDLGVGFAGRCWDGNGR